MYEDIEKDNSQGMNCLLKKNIPTKSIQLISCLRQLKSNEQESKTHEEKIFNK